MNAQDLLNRLLESATLPTGQQWTIIQVTNMVRSLGKMLVQNSKVPAPKIKVPTALTEQAAADFLQTLTQTYQQVRGHKITPEVLVNLICDLRAVFVSPPDLTHPRRVLTDFGLVLELIDLRGERIATAIERTLTRFFPDPSPRAAAVHRILVEQAEDPNPEPVPGLDLDKNKFNELFLLAFSAAWQLQDPDAPHPDEQGIETLMAGLQAEMLKVFPRPRHLNH